MMFSKRVNLGLSKNKGFTLVELLLVMGVLSVLMTIVASLYLNVNREQTRANLQNAVYEDAQFILENIALRMSSYTIDYEEYYSQLVLQKDLKEKIYGLNYGKYAERFYDPGLTLNGGPKKGVNPDNLGAECGDGTPLTEGNDCIVYTPSLDTNTGMNPYDLDQGALDATAFCDGDCPGDLASLISQSELYLISADGTSKVIFSREKVSKDGEYALATVELNGTDSDGNGIVDRYSCDEQKGFNCSKNQFDANKSLIGKLPNSRDLSDMIDLKDPAGVDFAPISTSRINVKDIQFIITPIEDPYKAFSEKDAVVQMQPHVTIILTIEPTKEVQQKLKLQQLPTITVQTTLTARVYQEVKSYPPLK